MLRPRLDTLPPHFAASQNFHLGVNPVVRTVPIAEWVDMHASLHLGCGRASCFALLQKKRTPINLVHPSTFADPTARIIEVSPVISSW